jgi:predicted Zn-dependent protease
MEGVWRRLTAMSVLVFIGALTGCGPGVRLVSQSDEIKLGRQAGTEFEQQSGGLDLDARRSAIARTLAARVGHAANAGDYPQYPYEVRVLNNAAVNANAFPGGIIYLWDGLFTQLDYDEDALAWVAGRECALVARQYAVQRVEKRLGYELIIQLVMGTKECAGLGASVSALTLQSYGRDRELEADRLGAVFAHAAGYDPTAALAALESFKQVNADPAKSELLFATGQNDQTRQNALKSFFRKQGWTGKYDKP